MLKVGNVVLTGGGDNCSRSRNAPLLGQTEISEFEKDLLEAIAQLETNSLEDVLTEDEGE